MAKRNRRLKREKNGFIRTTITIPGDCCEFVEARINLPAHRGNLSGYLSSLILGDKEKQEQEAKAG